MDCRLQILLESSNFALPDGVVNKIQTYLGIVDPKGLAFEKIERTKIEKIIYVAKIIFTLGICIYFYNTKYYKALKINNLNEAVLAIKQGANLDLTSEKIVRLVHLGNSNSLHFAISQCDFPEPEYYNYKHPYKHLRYSTWGDVGNTKEYWIAMNTLGREGKNSRFLWQILKKQSQNKLGLKSQMKFYNEYLDYCNRGAERDPRY